MSGGARPSGCPGCWRWCPTCCAGRASRWPRPPAHFGITEDQLVKDLELLFVCGTPGHMPDDLIEAEWESGQVYLGNAETISRPLRLAPDEAVALLVGLRTLAEVPGLHDREPLESALAKLSAAAGDASARAGTAARWTSPTASEAGALQGARQALRRPSPAAPALPGAVPGRGHRARRGPDAGALVGGHWYLEGWCHRAEAVRLFRLDRVADAGGARRRRHPAGAGGGRRAGRGRHRLFSAAERRRWWSPWTSTPAARWVADYYPVESTEQNPGGEPGLLRIRLRTANPAGCRGWCCAPVARARIVHPPELARVAAELARAGLAGYEVEPTGVLIEGPQDDSVEDPVEQPVP